MSRFEKAVRKECQIKAIDEEIAMIEKNKTWRWLIFEKERKLSTLSGSRRQSTINMAPFRS